MNKRALAARMLANTGLLRLARAAAPWSGVLALNYHRIGSAANSNYDHGLWSADADSFAWQLDYLRSRLDIITFEQLPEVLSRRRGRYALITFDDGYRDNYEVAFPILEAAGVKATFFVATGYIDQPEIPWWDEIAWLVRTSERDRIDLPGWLDQPVRFDDPDREQAVRCLLRRYKQLPADQTTTFVDAVAGACQRPRCSSDQGRRLWMSWDMLREMNAAGMAIGAHTVSHPVLANLDESRQQHEIDQSSRRIESELKQPVTLFSYPVGGLEHFNDTTRSCLQRAGMRYAASYYGGYRRLDDWDDLDVRRIAIEADTDRDQFRAIVDLPQVFARPG